MESNRVIIDSGEKINNFACWQVKVDGNTICSFFGPMSARCALLVAKALADDESDEAFPDLNEMLNFLVWP